MDYTDLGNKSWPIVHNLAAAKPAS